MRRATVLAAVAAALAAIALALAGCGGAGPSASPTGPAARALFAHSCGGCHSLIGHNLPKDQGGDLLHARLPRGVLFQYAREMPVPHRLTGAQLQTIVDYVLAVQRRG